MYHRVLLKISGEALSFEQSVICRETVLSTVDKIKAVSSHASQRAHGPGVGGVLWRALASPGPSHSDFLLPDESRPVPMGWLFLVLCRG